MSSKRGLPKLIVILGPTASGKSELAVNLARKFNGEIISADSRQIYKEMDIGTAKITKKEMKGVPHYLIGAVAPDKTLTLAEYQKKAIQAAGKIIKKGKNPILCGGTGLYIKALVDNLRIPEVPPNQKLREKIEKKIGRKGLAAVYQKLLKLDPGAKEFIDPKNPRRIIRALEVCLTAKKPFSELRQKGEPLFDALQIGINPHTLSAKHHILWREIKKQPNSKNTEYSRQGVGVKIPAKKLNERINKRVDAQIKAGLLKEVRRLAKKYPWNLPSMSGLGYKEFKNFLAGKETLESAVETLKKNTQQYGKRQMTWFKKAEPRTVPRSGTGARDPRIKWIKNGKEAERLVKNFLKN